jgi:hypothetical protein
MLTPPVVKTCTVLQYLPACVEKPGGSGCMNYPGIILGSMGVKSLPINSKALFTLQALMLKSVLEY